MESAILGVILDSSIAIEAERQQLNAAEFLRKLFHAIGERQVALCSITVAELAHGIYRANTLDRQRRRRLFLDDLKAALPVYSISDTTAELVGKLSGESSALGVNIPFDDLLIGGCALERSYGIATRNLRHFKKIPGLPIIPC